MTTLSNDVLSSVQDLDCAVCLQKCHHPTQLPCGHIFCFLCVKGVAIQSKRCAMCRADIPRDYLDHPVILEDLTIEQATTEEQNAEPNQWYYEGRNGWWKYDERSNAELEAAYGQDKADCSLLVAGAVYCVDFQTMMQFRRRDPTRRRRVRRDTPTLPAKGIAGIKINIPQAEPKNDSENIHEVDIRTDDLDGNQNDSEILNGSEDRSVILIENDDDAVITIDDDDTDEAAVNSTNDVHNVLEGLRSISLDSPPSTSESSGDQIS